VHYRVDLQHNNYLIYPSHLCTATTLPWETLIVVLNLVQKGLTGHVRWSGLLQH